METKQWISSQVLQAVFLIRDTVKMKLVLSLISGQFQTSFCPLIHGELEGVQVLLA